MASTKTIDKSSTFGILDLDAIVCNLKTTLSPSNNDNILVTFKEVITDNPEILHSDNNISNEENSKFDDDLLLPTIDSQTNTITIELPLSEIVVDINSIRPGNKPPLTIMDDPEGLKVMLHFARDHPRENVSVIVITTMNQNALPITNYQFDASVSKVSK